MSFHVFDKILLFLFALCTNFTEHRLNTHVIAIFLIVLTILECVQFENRCL